MKKDPSQAAASAVSSLRAQPWGLAVAAITDGETALVVDPSADKLDEDSQFQVGSLTKTVTGLLLADCVDRGETSLEATVGSVLGPDAGNCAELMLGDLAAQRSGLPRLPPNLSQELVDRNDPYAAYFEADLLEALKLVPHPEHGKYGYSNFGFMLLGLLLARITGRKYADLAKDRLFEPLGMSRSFCGLPPEDARLPGYAGEAQTPWWSNRLPGAGGITSSIHDIALYLSAHLAPPESMTAAIDLALRAHEQGPPITGLGWVHQGGAHWHNGATGGFRSFAALHRPSGCAIALLANSHDVEALDKTGFSILTDMVRARSS